MRKWILLATIILGSSPLMAEPFWEYDIIPFDQVSEDLGDAFFSGEMPFLVISYPEGSTLPLRLSVQGDCLSLDPAFVLPLQVLDTCYMRCVRGYFLCSKDLNNWIELSDCFSAGISLFLGVENQSMEGNILIDFTYNQTEPEESP